MIDDDVKWQHVARVATAARHRQMRAGTMMYNDYDPSYVDDKSNIDPLDPDAKGQHTPSPTTATPPNPPITAVSINATWSWLARFDVLLTLCSPYDTLDNTMRALPTGPQLEPYRRTGARYQKRGMYAFGVDPMLLSTRHNENKKSQHHRHRRHSSTSSSTNSDNNHNNHDHNHNHGNHHDQQDNHDHDNVDDDVHFDHMDLVWYRSMHELEVLEQHGLKVRGYFVNSSSREGIIIIRKTVQ